MPSESSARNHLAQIDRALDRVGDIALDPVSDQITPASGWSALQHAEHIRLATQGSLDQLRQALDRTAGPALKFRGRMFLIIGRIPRGRGRAPKGTAPSEAIDRLRLNEETKTLRQSIQGLEPDIGRIASGKGRASHPVFGGMTPARWLRFIRIHLEHHLAIVDEIEAVRHTASDESPKRAIGQVD